MPMGELEAAMDDQGTLGQRVSELKKLAFKVLKLEDENSPDPEEIQFEPGTLWGDINISEDMYDRLKTYYNNRYIELKTPHLKKRRAAIIDFGKTPDLKWPMPIKYTLIGVEDRALKATIKEALAEIQRRTKCIKFEHVDHVPSGPHIDFAEKRPANFCANSNIGRFAKGVNKINFGNCKSRAVVLHEVFHTLGAHHTFQRHDRDKFITINWNKIANEDKENYQFPSNTLEDCVGFDYESIMMYPANKDTIMPKIDKEKNIKLMGHSKHLSAKDVELMNILYTC